eukprot:gene1041-15367_t
MANVPSSFADKKPLSDATMQSKSLLWPFGDKYCKSMGMFPGSQLMKCKEFDKEPTTTLDGNEFAERVSWYYDRHEAFGRLKVLFPSLAVIIIVGFLSTFSPNFWVFLTTRIIVGFFTPGTGVQMFVMASEFVGAKYRPLSGIILWAFFTVALIILGVQAYFIREWKKLFIISTVPYIFVLAFAKFVPESIRWLNLNGRQEEAMKLLRRIAKFNKKELPDNVTLKAPFTGPKVKASPIDLFVPTKMALQSLVQSYAW